MERESRQELDDEEDAALCEIDTDREAVTVPSPVPSPNRKSTRSLDISENEQQSYDNFSDLYTTSGNSTLPSNEGGWDEDFRARVRAEQKKVFSEFDLDNVLSFSEDENQEERKTWVQRTTQKIIMSKPSSPEASPNTVTIGSSDSPRKRLYSGITQGLRSISANATGQAMSHRQNQRAVSPDGTSNNRDKLALDNRGGIACQGDNKSRLQTQTTSTTNPPTSSTGSHDTTPQVIIVGPQSVVSDSLESFEKPIGGRHDVKDNDRNSDPKGQFFRRNRFTILVLTIALVTALILIVSALAPAGNRKRNHRGSDASSEGQSLEEDGVSYKTTQPTQLVVPAVTATDPPTGRSGGRLDITDAPTTTVPTTAPSPAGSEQQFKLRRTTHAPSPSGSDSRPCSIIGRWICRDIGSGGGGRRMRINVGGGSL